MTFGCEATPADLYLIHLLSPVGSRSFLAALPAKPQQTSVALLGDQSGVFPRNGQSLTLAHAYAELQRIFDGAIPIAELRRT